MCPRKGISANEKNNSLNKQLYFKMKSESIYVCKNLPLPQLDGNLTISYCEGGSLKIKVEGCDKQHVKYIPLPLSSETGSEEVKVSKVEISKVEEKPLKEVKTLNFPGFSSELSVEDNIKFIAKYLSENFEDATLNLSEEYKAALKRFVGAPIENQFLVFYRAKAVDKLTKEKYANSFPLEKKDEDKYAELSHHINKSSDAYARTAFRLLLKQFHNVDLDKIQYIKFKYHKGTLIVPTQNPNDHNYPLNIPVQICFVADDEPADARGENVKGAQGNYLPKHHSSLRLATFWETLAFFTLKEKI
jgi:hypothetical protein